MKNLNCMSRKLTLQIIFLRVRIKTFPQFFAARPAARLTIKGEREKVFRKY